MSVGADAAVRGVATSALSMRWHTAGYLVATTFPAGAALSQSWSTPWSLAAATLIPLGIWGILRRVERQWLLPLVGIVDTLAGFDIFLGLGLFALAVRRRDSMTLVFALLGSASITIAALTRPPSGPPPLGPSAPTLAWLMWGGAMLAQISVPLLMGAWIGTQRELVISLRSRAQSAEAERQLRDREAVLQERERIAHEMHDALGHQLTLVAMQAGALSINPDLGPVEVHNQAELIRSTARQALVDLRQVVGALQEVDPPNIAGASGIAAVRDMVARSRQVTELQFDLRLPDASEPPEPTSRALSRIVQEGLTNAHRHAPGARIALTISGDPGVGVDVIMVNPLAPDAMPPGNGTGLAALAERVRVLGGSLEAMRRADHFRLGAHLPWPATTEDRP
jgi:signal transduction histidine kinase